MSSRGKLLLQLAKEKSKYSFKEDLENEIYEPLNIGQDKVENNLISYQRPLSPSSTNEDISFDLPMVIEKGDQKQVLATLNENVRDDMKVKNPQNLSTTLKNNTTEESNVEFDDVCISEAEDSSDFYVPTDVSSSDDTGEDESDTGEEISNPLKHVTAEASDNDLTFLEKREVVKKKIFEVKEKTYRKKVKVPHSWKRQKAAKARENGEAYLSQTGKIMPAKQINDGILCKEKCRLQCSQKFRLEDRERILRKYYTLDINAKNALLFKSIKIVPVERHRANARKNKENTFHYSITYNKKVEPICKDALCSLYQFSKKKVEIIQNKLKGGQCAPSPDQRGRHLNRPHKLGHDVINSIVEHIKKFPKEASHYSRNHNPHKMYLSPTLNISIMYQLYLEECDELQYPPQFKCKRSSYSNIFATKFNLSFGHPKSDTCSTCDSGEGTDDHKAKYKLAFEKQRCDRLLSTENSSICYVTMDLQQTMPLPKLTTSKAFYLRQMWFYNFGVHTVTKSGHQTYFFNWTEDWAGRGSTEIASCLFRFVQLLKDTYGNSIKHLVIWSDSCSGQNKNFNIISLYQYFILNGWFETIDHKFPEVGHSYLDSDRDFGRIEQKLRLVENIYVPDQYRQIIQNASPKNTIITDMTHYFRDFEELGQNLHLVNKKKNMVDEKVNFRDSVKWVRINEFGCYLYKDSLKEDEPFKKVNLLKPGSRVIERGEVIIRRLESKRGNLSQAKIKNLQEQMKFVKDEYVWFYENILPKDTRECRSKKRKTI